MRSISTAMAAWLASDVLTWATCVQITRADGSIWGFTDHDVDIVYGGLTYSSFNGFSGSAIEYGSSLSTSNLEINGLLFPSGGAFTLTDIEGGVWSNAAVFIFGVNYADLTMGQINLVNGNLGNFTLLNGAWKVELRGVSQTFQQAKGDQFSPTCRANLGDSRCKINLAPLTATGAVTSIVNQLQWNDTSLTQVGPTVPFVDSMGHRVPTTGPYTIQAVAPSGSFQSDGGVIDAGGNSLAPVGGAPGSGQYSASPSGLYTFNIAQAGWFVKINFNYAVGYFAYGLVKWTSGANAGLTGVVKTSSVGSVTLGMPMPNPIQVGDTYTIVAGCDKQMGTCRDRYNNLVNNRSEPYVPGPDTILRAQGS
ncbi:DUF2163 domain-containing protein [Burkholderia ambifaria]|uniref:DUF2163 domain-containing protein n=1 Tax=Burkholderia ambifaria TaxID=152480 RepID=UPI001B960AE4|nr:DUF2163 domain-containing protein [Burkholderia ambifaria]MBR8344648.1 DUF2163 domain-containing protein [Burkholderia ambifaria]